MHEIKLLLSAKLCAVTVFYFVDVPSPQHCKSLALVLHCLRFLEHCKLSQQKRAPALSHRSYRCYIYMTPLGSMARIYRNVFAPSPLKALRTLRALSLGKNKRAVMCVC